MKPEIGKKYKLYIKKSDFLDEYKGTGTCVCKECGEFWFFDNLKPFDGKSKKGCFTEPEIIKEIK